MTMLKQGTLSDRVSSLSLLVSKNPLATISYLTDMLNQAKKPNRKIAEQAITSFKNLLVQDKLVDPNKKTLHLFQKNPLIIKHS